MKYLVIGLLFSTSVFADYFKIGGELIEFKAQDGLLVKGCEKKCKALTTVSKHKKINLKKVRQGEKFHGSVGSDVCRLVYKAGSTIGVMENLDQRAFCVFDDNSAIEINSLSDYLVSKKIVTE